MTRQLFISFLLLLASLATSVSAQVLTSDIAAHVSRGEFEVALKKANEANAEQRNQLLGQVVVAMAKDGKATEAKAALRQIASFESANETSSGEANVEPGVQGAAGGASGADFDTLINLITSTVAPSTWDDVGGPGAIESFDGGVSVDAKGVLRQMKSVNGKRTTDLNLLREAKRHDQGTDTAANARKSSRLRMVSLNRLQRELQLQVAFGERPTDEMKWLAGLREIRYLFLFPETQDIVIAGPAGDWDAEGANVLLLDDLVTILKANGQNDGKFGCSIDPKRDNLVATQRFLSTPTGTLKPSQTPRWVGQIREKLGRQDISIRGIDPQSHAARTLVEADYHMKLVGMGLAPGVPGVESYLESISASEVPKSMDVLRWWFTLKPDSVRKNEVGDAYVFAKQVVQLQSENETINGAGERVHTGKSSALNQLFANRFTKNFKSLAKAYPVYARLEGLLRMSLAVSLIQSDEVRGHVDWDASWFVSTYRAATGNVPQEVPSIVNHRVINRRHVVVGVSGGVTVDSRTATRNVRLMSKTGAVTSDQQSAKPRFERTSDRWWWD